MTIRELGARDAVDAERLLRALRAIVDETARLGEGAPAPGRRGASVAMVARRMGEGEAPVAMPHPDGFTVINVPFSEDALERMADGGGAIMDVLRLRAGSACAETSERGIMLSLLLRDRRLMQLILSVAPTTSQLFRAAVRGANEDRRAWVTLRPDDLETVCDLAGLMAVAYAERPEDWGLELEGLATTLMAVIARSLPEEARATDAASVVSLALQDIAARPAEVTLEGLAERFSYSPSRLSELIRQQTGRTFSQIVGERRMERAAWLLRNAGLAARDVAALVGYESVSSFYKAFRARFGVTPGAYAAGACQRPGPTGAVPR